MGKAKWILEESNGVYTARQNRTGYFFEYAAAPMSLELLKWVVPKKQLEGLSNEEKQTRFANELGQYAVTARGLSPDSDGEVTPTSVEKLCSTLEQASAEARDLARIEVEAGNYTPPPPPKGSFYRNGEEKGCKTCGESGEACECWRYAEDAPDSALTAT